MDLPAEAFEWVTAFSFLFLGRTQESSFQFLQQPLLRLLDEFLGLLELREFQSFEAGFQLLMERLAVLYAYFLAHFPLEGFFRSVYFRSAVDLENFDVSLYVLHSLVNLRLQFQVLFFQGSEAGGPGLNPGLGNSYLQLLQTVQPLIARANLRLERVYPRAQLLHFSGVLLHFDLQVRDAGGGVVAPVT